MIKKKVPCTANETKSFVASPKFVQYIGTLNEPIEIIVGEKITVKTGRGKTTFPLKLATTFPTLQGSTKRNSVVVESEHLKKALKRCQHFGIQGPLTGLLIRASSSDLRFVSSDGYVLEEYIIEGTFPNDEVVIPNEFLRYLRLEGQIKIIFGETTTFFTDNTIIQLPTIDAAYPNYKLFDLTADKYLTINRSMLIESLERALTLEPMYNCVHLKAGQHLTITADSDFGQFSEELECEGTCSMYVNARQLLHLLGNTDKEDVTLSISNRLVGIQENGAIVSVLLSVKEK